MKMQIYTIRDSKAEVYNLPFFKNTDLEAQRDFHRLVNDKNSIVNQYPEDYDLYLTATFDDQSGVIQPLDTPKHIIKAVNIPQNPMTAPVDLSQANAVSLNQLRSLGISKNRKQRRKRAN